MREREREEEKERMIERHREIEGESGRKRDRERGREIMSVNDSCKEGSTILNLTSDICSSLVP